MQITNKREMYDLQFNWALGNCLRVWQTIEEVRKSSYKGPIAIRSLVTGKKMQTHINQNNLELQTENYLKSRHLRKGQIIYSEMAAPDMGFIRTLNAEVMLGDIGIVCRYYPGNMHMPQAMEKAKEVKMLTAKLVLDNFLDRSDYDSLIEILEKYDGAVAEISIYKQKLGWANKRMLVWEVRNY